MQPINGANSSRPFYDVHIDVPAVGYPAAPPPPSKHSRLRSITCGCFLLASLISIFGIMVYEITKVNLPRFQLDSVSVSVHNNPANITAVWDIGFSIDRAAGDLDVWARFMSRDFKVESPGSAGNQTVSISTLLPRGSTTNIIPLERVVFKCKSYQEVVHRYILMAACEDVAVEISSTQGEMMMMMMMKGGSRVCPMVFQQTLNLRH